MFQFPELTVLIFVDVNVVVSGNIFFLKQILVIRLLLRFAPTLYFDFLIVTSAVRIFSTVWKTKANKSSRIFKQIFAHFLDFSKIKSFWIQLFVILSTHKPCLGYMWAPTQKFGPDWFSRFDVYWIQLQTDTDKQIHIYK